MRTLLLILTGILMGVTHIYLGTMSIVMDGYIISYILGLVARKVIEPKEKGREILSTNEITLRNNFYGMYSLFGKKGNDRILIVRFLILLLILGVGMFISIINNGVIHSYSYILAGMIMSIDMYLYYKKFGIKVYEKGIQRGVLFYKWNEVGIRENQNGLELVYIRNLVFNEHIFIYENIDEIKKVKREINSQ